MGRKMRRFAAALSVVLSVLGITSGVAAASSPATVLDGNLAIQTSNDLRCLDVYANGAGPWVQVWWCNGHSNQKFFRILYQDTETYEFRTSDYWCVDARWGRGTSLERSPCTGSVSQRFRLDAGLYGFVIRSVMYPDQVWDVYDHGHGTEVQLWDYNPAGVPNQGWTFAPA
jgi:ricin-type beta-trefoil lectin protein